MGDEKFRSVLTLMSPTFEADFWADIWYPKCFCIWKSKSTSKYMFFMSFLSTQQKYRFQQFEAIQLMIYVIILLTLLFMNQFSRLLMTQLKSTYELHFKPSQCMINFLSQLISQLVNQFTLQTLSKTNS
jgi:hypothetical protein